MAMSFAEMEKANIERCKKFRYFVDCGTANPGSTPPPAATPIILSVPRRRRGGKHVREGKARHAATLAPQDWRGLDPRHDGKPSLLDF